MKALKNLLALFLLNVAAGRAVAQDATADLPNLLTNSSFEEGDTGWQFSSWHSRGIATVDTNEKHDGKASIRIENSAADDSFLKQTVAVKLKTRYRLSGFIKTKDVLVKGTGATLSLEGGFEATKSMIGDREWTKVSFEFDTGPLDTVKVGARLGHHGSMAMGTAWFDGLSLVELGPTATVAIKPVLPPRPTPMPDIYPRWSVVGEWRGTHPDWTDIVTLREDGTLQTTGMGTTGRWTLTAEGGTPLLVFRWDQFGTESLTMVGPDHFRGKTRNGRHFDLRRGDESVRSVER